MRCFAEHPEVDIVLCRGQLVEANHGASSCRIGQLVYSSIRFGLADYLASTLGAILASLACVGFGSLCRLVLLHKGVEPVWVLLVTLLVCLPVAFVMIARSPFRRNQEAYQQLCEFARRQKPQGDRSVDLETMEC